MELDREPEVDLAGYPPTPFRQLVRETGLDYFELWDLLEAEVERRRTVATTGDNPARSTPEPSGDSSPPARYGLSG